MTLTAMLIAALVLLPAVGLLTWAWFVTARVVEKFRFFGGFEGRHFEIGRQAAENTEGASRWATPG